MLKKTLSTFMFGMLGVFGSAQTIVSTSPQNKKVILEDFTGIACVYCPAGHAEAQSLMDENPGNVFAINIHTGNFANGTPNFKTPYGDAIAAQSGLLGYPSGTINRHVFPGRGMTSGGTAMTGSHWRKSTNEMLLEESPVNIAVEASIDLNSRLLTVHVEAYYTNDSSEQTNMLNIALLQNNTLGPQTGGGMGDNYNHMYRLVELITGQWGETINTTTSGTFVDRTFTYTIPAEYNDVPAILEDMEIVAFIADTTQEIQSGNSALPTFIILGIEDNNLESINLYPNPAKSIINLKNAENSDIKVYDVLGKMIYAANGISMDQEINVANFESGTYFIKISKDNNVSTKRFVVSK